MFTLFQAHQSWLVHVLEQIIMLQIYHIDGNIFPTEFVMKKIVLVESHIFVYSNPPIVAD